MGMFTTRDPIGLMGGDNVFAYAPNPTGWIDPLGLAADGVLNKVGKGLKLGAKIGRGVPGVIWQAITPTTMGDATLPIDSEALERVRAKAEEKDSPCTSGRCCPDCVPYPEGTPGYQGPKTSVRGKNGSRNNDGVGIPHYKMYIVEQDRRDCSCKWKLDKRAQHHILQEPNGINLNSRIKLNTGGSVLSYP